MVPAKKPTPEDNRREIEWLRTQDKRRRKRERRRLRQEWQQQAIRNHWKQIFAFLGTALVLAGALVGLLKSLGLL